ncbi:PHP domain protein [Halothece sp. PCC 7418]|uniref:PHP domain-containing protein n=1 Tax=Halothece sp. (strain PCC 7418) TaxID=65093 RepID=UPI0002A06B6F|nr:PHP domain-containing protein [Halothece sp. PCC 7418]AFZ44455.1 PHP domain protein [Halothece sp. PCC 7418]
MPTTYFPGQSQLSLQGQDTPTLKAIWETINADSCPHYYNFHLHTICSDGQLDPKALIQQALEINLQGLAITDHHTVKGYRMARQYLESYGNFSSFPQLWTGVEITSILMETEVHILGYGFNPEHPTILPYLRGQSPKGVAASAKNVINAIHEADGLVVLAHPERYRRPAKELIPAGVALGIDGVETYYAYKNTIPWRPSAEETMEVKALSQQYDLFNTCGTDTHGLDLLQRV